MNLKKFFKSNKITYNLATLIMTISLIGILFIINIFAQKLNWRFDLSIHKVNSLSNETIEYINKIEENVDIVVFFRDTIPEIKNIIDEYEKKSKKINIKYIDPEVNPTLANKYRKDGEPININTIIVESGSKFKTLNISDLYTINNSNNTITSMVEQKITLAIGFVLDKENRSMYVLTGVNEEDINTCRILNQILENMNFSISKLNLIEQDMVPQDADILFLLSPKRDLIELEIQRIEKYLEGGGRLLLVLEPGVEFERLNLLLKNYNLSVNNDLIVEGDRNRVFAFEPLNLKPEILITELTKDLQVKNLNYVLPIARSIEVSENKNENLIANAFARSSELSWSKTNLSELVSLYKEDTDRLGPLNIAATAEKLNEGGFKNSKIVLYGSSSFVTDIAIQRIGGTGNYDLIFSTLTWLSEYQKPLLIDSKIISVERFNITSNQALVVIIIITSIPLIIITLGIIVWVRRRYR